MLKISYRNQFKKELHQQEKRGKDMKKFFEVAEKLARENLSDQNTENTDSLESLKGSGNVILSLADCLFISKLRKRSF
ncbi:hypothetical protein NEOC65_002079 [Neochlamydia sp. AcF65]|nr:hypothetical protein [Neochlamydia sp. AcF65]MBS4170394.1 hypothetical protein [Neochlamydia sp. AcF95]NGY95391.1 hypothetical protein [Neochlamydia sp. AcF84]